MIVRYTLICLWLQLSITSVVFAQEHTSTPPADSWAGQLKALVEWVKSQEAPVPPPQDCEPACYVLEKLTLTGSMDAPALGFEIRGGVIGKQPVNVPLFGTPDGIQLDEVTENNAPAVVGFASGTHYFARTSSPRFVIKGKLTFHNETTLTIPGPLNSLVTKLEGGRLIEGALLSGLSDAHLHFEKIDKNKPGDAEIADQPPVFDVSRALRIGRERRFEYRIHIRSGRELGVLSFPLTSGEQVLAVEGAPNWQVAAGSVTLPIAGKTAEVTISGVLSALGTLSMDGRSAHEWWLIESSPEYRLEVTTTGKMMDTSESPIEVSEASARLYLLERGQTLSLTARELFNMPGLGVAVSDYTQRAVLTPQGDWIIDGMLRYENNGVDFLNFNAAGKPIFVAHDDKPTRILGTNQKAKDILIAIAPGRHEVRVQSLEQAKVSGWLGHLQVPFATYAFPTSQSRLQLGLPETVVPLMLRGGDTPWSTFSLWDIVIVALTSLLGWWLLRSVQGGLLGGAALWGLYRISPVGFELLLGGLCLVLGAWFGWRILQKLPLPRWFKTLCALAAVGGIVLAGLVTLVFGGGMAATHSVMAPEPAFQAPASKSNSGNVEETQNFQQEMPASDGLARGGYGGNPIGLKKSIKQALQTGTAPVPLPVPASDRNLFAHRQLVTTDRGFAPALWYAGDGLIKGLIIGWAMVLGWLFYLLYRRYGHVWFTVKDWLRG